VEDETDVDDQNLAGCNFNQERCDFLYEISVIFWDEFISNDRIPMEAVSEELKQDGIHHVITFFCVPVILLRHVYFVFQNSIYIHLIQFNPPILSYSIFMLPPTLELREGHLVVLK
jgi:hypothetical protein